MAYVTGYVLAVPTAKKAAYKSHAEQAWPIFADHGALSMRETWGVDVPDGKVTSFPMAVQKADDETVVFGWLEWPDKATSEAGWHGFMQDPRMAELQDMASIFDGRRMIWGGFEDLVRTDDMVPA